MASTESTLMTVGEVARALRCSIALVYKLVDAGRLPAVRITDRAIRIDEHDLAEYLLRTNEEAS
jgi:excisionase family DNA binding protein